MRRGRHLCIVVGLVLLACTGRATAQGPGMGGPATADSASPLLIAMSPVVQSELKLKDDQKLKVYELIRTMSQKQRELMQSIMFGGATSPQEIFQARTGLRKEIEQSLGQILDKKQNERFLQIVLRAEGPLAVARPEIASRLGLNGSKAEQVQVIAIQLQARQRVLFMTMRANGVAAGGEGFNRQAVNEFTQASNGLRKEAVQLIARVLNKTQRDAFDKMLGEPFDLAKLNSSDSSTSTTTEKADSAKTDTNDSAKADSTKDKDASSTASDDDPKPEEKTKSPAKKKTRKGR